MNLRNKNILLVSPEPWEHIFVSKHHYAIYLTKYGNSVWFLNPPSKEEKCVTTEYDRLHSVSYTGFIRGLRFFPNIIQKLILKNKFKQLQKLCKTKFDVVWSFDNSVFFDFSAFPEEVYSISHIVDWNQDFEFNKATKTANLCLASSNFILEKQKQLNTKSYNIGHGFNQIKGEIDEFKIWSNNKVNCGYAGNLDIKYIDWRLVQALIFNFPNVDFHFVGQWNSKFSFKHILEKPNFHYYGKLDAKKLPSFYQEMDILLLIYLFDKFQEQLANPHKMMEYLGTGKFISAMWMDEYEELVLNDLIFMSKTYESYLERFNLIVENITELNSIDKRNMRIKIAQKNTYYDQINKIIKLTQD